MTPIELVAGRVFALGGEVELDGRLSWVADGVAGRAPLACYLVLDGRSALLLDTGVPAHEEVLLDQLASLLPAGAQLTLLLTRVVEFDSFGNAASVLAHFPVTRAYSQFPIDEWVWYRAVHDGVSRPPAPPWLALRGGVAVPLGTGDGQRELVTFDAPLRLLATTWVYDPYTRVLFTSDAFGHAVTASGEAGGPVTSACDTTGFEVVRDHLLAKFAWLAEADTGPIRGQLAAIVEGREIDVIAPTYGRPLVGRDVASRHVELVDRALAEVGARAGARA